VTTFRTLCAVDVGKLGGLIENLHEYAVVNVSRTPAVPLLIVVPAINGELQSVTNPGGFVILFEGIICIN